MKDEMDILREVGSTAAAHGSIALSEILGKRISLYLPSVDIIPYMDIRKTISVEGIMLSLQTQILSGLNGKIVFMLEEKTAYKLIDMCYRVNDDVKKGSLYTEIGMSLVKEVGNVVISSYIGALACFLKRLIIPSLPILINAPFEDIMKVIVMGYEEENYMLVVESLFEEKKETIKGNFWLILAPQAAEEIKEACKKLLSNLKE